MKQNLFLIFSCTFFLIIGCTEQSNQTSKCYYKGIDTCRYLITYQANANVFLIDKTKATGTPEKMSLLGEQIEPKEAEEMIAYHINGDVDPISHKLGKQYSRFVDFEISKLSGFLSNYRKVHKDPDFLRIYFGRYSPTHATYPGRQTTILVGMMGSDEIYEPGDKNAWPVNIGTLCPPDCNPPGDDFANEAIGARFMKKGAKKAGATSWN